MAAVSIALSGCVLPPVVTAISVGADIFSLAETGKTVSDHGISLVMQRDCAMMRVFDGEICRDFAPSEDTPEGALVALAALSDPVVNPAQFDPMVVPRNLAYLEGALGLAVAGGPTPARNLPVPAFSSFRGKVGAAKLGAGELGANEFGAAVRDDLAFLAAGIQD